MQQAHVVISGFVQGVGFRHFVRSNARKRGVSGWVRNTKDNKVEAVFEGSKEHIDEMIALCNKGPLIAEVEKVEIARQESRQEFEGFEMRV